MAVIKVMADKMPNKRRRLAGAEGLDGMALQRFGQDAEVGNAAYCDRRGILRGNGGGSLGGRNCSDSSDQPARSSSEA